MPIFDYKDYDSQTAAQMVATTQKLAAYTNAASVAYLPAAKLFNGVGKMMGAYFANPIHIAPPSHWRELSPHDLGLPEHSRDVSGYYTIASSVTGNRPISGMGPQAKIFGEFVNGKISKICLSWCGTNDPLDVADYFHLNEGKIAPHMNPLLHAIKNFSQEHGLQSEDVWVTGYSLGGGLTNVMAKYREQLADGFFNHANYIGHESPLIFDDPNVVLNIGYENDAVFRIAGNEATFHDAATALKPLFVNPDKDFQSSIDNVVLFNDEYASPLWNPTSLSLLNLGQGWSAHINGVWTDALERMAQSPFYDYMQRDSRIIVDSLTAIARPSTWVRDKAQTTQPIFMIGNEYNNLLQDSTGGDYIDARAGNDKIKLSDGADTVNGGAGVDTVILSGSQQDWQAYRLSDNTLFLHHQQHGLKQLSQVEQISFSHEWRSEIHPYTIESSGIMDHRYLIQHRNQHISYQDHREGTEQNDDLTGKIVFGQAGNDVLHALTSGSLLHGGTGHDVLLGHRGNDELYGAEGNDWLYAGAGHDRVYGGVGNDVFVFDRHTTGITEIKDFNHYAGEHDQLLFSKDLFDSAESVLSAAQQHGNDVWIDYQHTHIILNHTTLDELNQHILIA